MNSVPSDIQKPVIHTISELNQMVASLLGDCFPASLWITGEISNFSCPRSGHWYFCLKDAQAQARCVFFQGQLRAQGLQLTDGMQVIVRARLSLYEARGEFQLVVEQVEAAGDGVLQQAFEVLKRRLAAEGLFDAARKRPLPSFVKSVGVITSPTGAVIRDILAILKRRFPALAVIIYPTAVQGEAAAAQIVRQLAVANERAECDVLIVARGGGSLEDLWPFNEEKVARALHKSHIPVISAVGHEVDVTIADFTADLRAPTPSAAAELVSPNQVVWMQSLQQLEDRLIRAFYLGLERQKQRLIQLQNRLRHPMHQLQNNWQRLDEWSQRLQTACQHQLQAKQQQLASLSRALDTVSPLSTLARGYALVKRCSDNKVVYNCHQIEVGERLVIQLHQGQLVCTVNKKIDSF